MAIWIQDCGFNSACASIYGREIAWKEGEGEQKGIIVFVSSHGVALVHMLDGESKMIKCFLSSFFWWMSLINMLVEIVLTTMPSSASRAWCVPRTIPIMCHKQTYDHVWKHFQIGSDEWASGVSHKGRLGRVRIYVIRIWNVTRRSIGEINVEIR